MLQTSPLLRVIFVIFGVVTFALLTGIWLLRRVNQASNSVEFIATRAATRPSVTLQEDDYDLASAPADVQACTKAIIGEDAGVKLIARVRRPNRSENDAMGECFQALHHLPSANQSSSVSTSPAVVNRLRQPSGVSSSVSSGASASATSSTAPAPSPSPTVDIHAEVWTKNGHDGASYEYKVNCGSNYATLEECFLWDLTRVAVTAPGGQVYQLQKDFNINSYSGEVTRRWVLYGPAGGGLPAAGLYTFSYEREEIVVYSQTLTYSPAVVDPPKNVSYVREGDDLIISWEAPAGITSQMWYKPSVDPPGNERQIISRVEAWNQTSARLADVPVGPGEQIEINVAVFFPGGYAYPQPLVMTW